MAAFIVSVCDITNPGPNLKQYAEESARLIARHGGSYLVRGKAADLLEGEGLKDKVLIITSFPTMKDLRAFYDGEDYQKIKHLRQGTGVYDIGVYESPAG